MADCLTLLRQYNLQKKEIVERDGLILFDQTAWARNAKTNYLSYRSGHAGPKEYYTLESLLFLLKNVSLSHPSYVARAGAQNIPVIKFPDRRDLLKYLNGELDTSPSIDKSVHLEMGIPAPAPKRANDEAPPEAAKKPRIESEADKQRIAKKLEAKGKGAAITDQVHSLSDAISREKIAAFKAKRLAKKRATIKPGDDLAGGPDRMFINDATKEITSKERVHRTRSSVLQSTGKDFSNVFSLVQSVKARDDGREEPVGGGGGGGGGGKQPVAEEPRHQRNQAPPTHGYSRYDQEKFRGQEETGEFKIDTTGTYHGLTLKSVTEAVSKPKPTVQSTKIQSRKPVQQDVAKPVRRDHRSRTPIIIVPSAATSLITMINVKTLLEEYKFVPSEEMKRLGVKRQIDMVIQRRKPHPTQPGQTVSIPYRIIDNPTRLKPLEWRQVVAVFVAGQAWQFKGWPGLTSDGSPVNIFSKIKAFHLRFEDSRQDPNIQKWDVHLLQISQNRRHLDKQSIMRFWETLDRFISQHQLDLRY